jgi:hypothetical protein
MMRRAPYFFVIAVLLSLAVLTSSAFGQTTPPPSFSTTLNPPPANQEFAAVLRIWTNPATIGFWDGRPVASHVNGNVVDIQFDVGCGFLCPAGTLQYQNYPFTMPALPDGHYVLRFVAGFEPNDPLYAQFDIAVGNGTLPLASLPVGGGWSVLLGGLLALLAGIWIRKLHRKRRTLI